MASTGFSLQHARTIRSMVEEINSEPPARIAVGGNATFVAALGEAIAGDATDAVVVETGGASRDDLQEYLGFVAAIDAWPLSDVVLEQLRNVDRASVPIVAVLRCLEQEPRSDEIPYVLATDVIRASDIEEAVVPTVSRVATRAKGEAYRLARAMPQFRETVGKAIIRHYSRRNGLVGAASMVAAADLPVLTMNQLRMVSRLAGAYGIELDAKRLVELGVVVGAGVGLRSVVRSALSALPGPVWAIKGGTALGGTVAIGEAAVMRFRAEVESEDTVADIHTRTSSGGSTSSSPTA